MNRIKKIFILVHIVLWVVFSLLVALQLSQDDIYWLDLTMAFISTCLYVFYSRFFHLKRYSGKRKDSIYFLTLVGIILTGPFPFLVIHPNGFETWQFFYQFYIMQLITTVPVFIILGWLARVTENLVLNTIKKEQLEKQAVQAELYYLKSQINPHFLFNTLNNIHTLVYKQAATAPEAVLKLSSLMRYMIYESNAQTVPLSREMTYLQDYISLQQLRYKKAPVVTLKIVGDQNACFIAPLLFVHFLENAYKHSPARLEPGDIKITVEIIDNSLIFTIQNLIMSKPGEILDELGGIGLPNIRKRLQLLYPEKHKLEISSTTDIYTIILKIDNIHSQPYERKDHLLYHR